MAAAIALGVLGVWILIQTTAGRLPGRVLSYRAAGGGVPGITPAGFASAGMAGGALATIDPAASTSGRLDAVTVARAVLNAGLNPEQAAIAVAIAGRESSYITTVHNDVYPDDSYGLWQINRLAHPQYSPAELSTLEGNLRAMLAISSGGTNWQPWTTASGIMTGTDIGAAREAVRQAMGAR